MRPVADLIFDIGMHKGEDTAYYLAKGYRVVAFEANGALVAACRERFAPELADGRLTIVEGAISDTREPTITFYAHRNTVWGTIEPPEDARFAELSTTVEVPVVNLPQVIAERGMPSFMKIDIEGADTVCLRALGEFEEHPPFLSIEVPGRMPALEEHLSLLGDLGYKRFAVVQQATIPRNLLETTTLSGEPLSFRFEEGASGPFGDEVGPWLSREQAMKRYRGVFLRYRLLDRNGPIRRTRLGRGLVGQAGARLHIPLPGWYDTHARL